MNSLIDRILGLLYPRKCICCGERISDDEDLCKFCHHWIERVPAEKRCSECGLIKDHCQCSICAYHFVKVVAPFYNSGLAQRGFYRLKFGLRRHYAKFFAQEMAKTVHSEFFGVTFDAVCYVPISRKHYHQRGFDQSKLLATEISKCLKTPLLQDAILCQFGGKTQHELSWKERFTAIRQKYRVGMDVKGRILLVDDIKTSGATLDECARELLFAGADEVYCVAALISDPNFEVTSEYTKEICAKS